MSTSTQDLTQEIIAELIKGHSSPKMENVGEIITIADGVVRASGLSEVAYLEMVQFDKDTFGVAINLEETEVGIIVLGPFDHLKAGDTVKTTGQILSIPVGDKFIGRVVNPLGVPVDNKGAIKPTKVYPLEKIAPSVTVRQPVTVSLATGIKAIDSMVPIGRGQRELIIGDRGVGKTTIALDTIINQVGKDVICIYVAIGQKSSRLAQVVEYLDQNNSLAHTIIVSATASDSAALQYLAPYAGSALAEYFMDEGKDVLVVYDDLTKHAWAYRQISLVLKRPSGREAYPGDIFYLHSRLLERACRLDNKHGGGSITALPVIETQAGDISAYIPTNVISITDGQIFLEPDLFYQGIRPAISVGLSVSRVGGNAQTSAMKQVAGKLRLDLAQYRDLAAFAQFASDLEESTRKQIEKGRLMTELLKQPLGSPMSVGQQVAILWAGSNNHLNDLPTSSLTTFATQLQSYLDSTGKNLLEVLNSGKKLTPEVETELLTVINKVKASLS